MTSEAGIVSLASAGDNVSIWDTESYKLQHYFAPCGSTHVRSVGWSPDGHQIVSVPGHGKQVSLTLVKAQKLQHMMINPGFQSSCAAFSVNSDQYLGIGGISGDVIVYDIRGQKPRTIFNEHHDDEVTCLHFNPSDSFLASASKRGKILMHNVVTSQSTVLSSLPSQGAVNAIQYANIRKYMLVSAYTDGSVCIWDTAKRQLSQKFSGIHGTACLDVSLSPLNNILLISVGLDKKIVMYDSQSKSIIKTLISEDPLTSVDFMDDGRFFAVGTTKGRVHIYDLQCSANPVKLLEAHGSKVASVKYQHKPSKIFFASLMKSESTKSPFARFSSNEVSKGSSVGSESGDSEVFTPPRLGVLGVNLTLSGDGSKVERKQPIGGGSLEEVSRPAVHLLSTEDMSNFSHHFGCKSSTPEQKSVADVKCQMNSLHGSTENNILCDDELLNFSWSSNAERPDVLGGKGETSENVSSVASSVDHFGLRSLVVSPGPGAKRRKESPIVPSSEKSTEVNGNISPCSTLKGFQAETIRQIVREEVQKAVKEEISNIIKDEVHHILQDELEEVYDRVHRDIHVFHVDTIKQFFRQTNELKEHIKQMSLNEELLKEVERLKEENRYLKKTF